MQIKVLFFATLRERAGVREVSLDIPADLSILDFKGLIVEQYPALAPGIPSALISVNREFAFDEQIIPANAEIAIFPPVSGG
jgi:MoaE-MoaD fusion protein